MHVRRAFGGDGRPIGRECASKVHSVEMADPSGANVRPGCVRVEMAGWTEATGSDVASLLATTVGRAGGCSGEVGVDAQPMAGPSHHNATKTSAEWIRLTTGPSLSARLCLVGLQRPCFMRASITVRDNLPKVPGLQSSAPLASN